MSQARTTGIVAVMWVALAMSLPARSLGLPSGQTKDLTGSVSGRVTVGGQPARGVAVLLLRREGEPPDRQIARATTDRDGNYQMTGVPAGQHLILAFAPALIAGPGNNTIGSPARVVNISSGEALDKMDIALTRGAVITGRVTDADGQPLIQEYVRLLAVDEQGRQVPKSFQGNASMYTTDDRGVYRIFGVPPGRYFLCVGINTSGRQTRGGNSGYTFYPLTFHPGVTDEAKATVVEVAAGGEAAGVDIVLGPASKAYSVSGRIIDAATSKPLSGLEYGYGWLDREDGLNGTSFADSTSGTSGEFRLDGVAPGRYAAFAEPPSDSEIYSDTAAFTVSDGDVTGIEIKVHRGSTISGKVVIDGVEAQRGAPGLSDLRLGVSCYTPNVAPVHQIVNVAADGSFRATGLPRGIANISLSMFPPPKGLSFIRLERDGVEQKDGIEVGLAEEISGVRMVFGYGTGSIRGQVQIEGGQIPPGAFMFVRLQQLDHRQPQQFLHNKPTAPDSSGKFAFDGLLPGEYNLLLIFQVVRAGDSSQMSPKVVDQRVTVNNGAETPVTIVVDPIVKDE